MAAVTNDTAVVGIKEFDFKTRTIAVNLLKTLVDNSEDTVHPEKMNRLPSSDSYAQILLISINNTLSDPDATLVEDGYSTKIVWDSDLTGIARP
jgi:hypothetical protein